MFGIGFLVAFISAVLLLTSLGSVTFRSAPSGAQVLRQLGLADRPELAAEAQRVERRARRARRTGAIVGLLVGGFFGATGEFAAGRSLAAPWAGYLLGLLVAELTLRRPRRDSRRSAGLTPRTMRQLSPPGRHAVAMVALAGTAVAAPLVLLGHRPTPVTSYTGPDGTCSTTNFDSWPSVASVLTIGALAAGALVLIEVLRWRLVYRAEAAEVDDAEFERRRRVQVAILSDWTGIALALGLLAALGNSVANALWSQSCDAAHGPGTSYLYASWLADRGRDVMPSLSFALLASSAAVIAWAPRRVPSRETATAR